MQLMRLAFGPACALSLVMLDNFPIAARFLALITVDSQEAIDAIETLVDFSYAIARNETVEDDTAYVHYVCDAALAIG